MTQNRDKPDDFIVAAYQPAPHLMEGRLIEGYKEQKAIDRKITTLSKPKAIAIVAYGSYSTLGKEASWRPLSMITQKQGAVYTITCVDLDDRFQASIPVFRKKYVAILYLSLMRCAFRPIRLHAGEYRLHFPSIIRGHSYLSIRRQDDYACPVTLEFHVGVRLRKAPPCSAMRLRSLASFELGTAGVLGAASQKCRE